MYLDIYDGLRVAPVAISGLQELRKTDLLQVSV